MFFCINFTTLMELWFLLAFLFEFDIIEISKWEEESGCF